jgi:hypothetical protein
VGIHKERSRDQTTVPEALRSFYVAGGGKGSGGACPITEDRRATPPDNVAARVMQLLSLALGALCEILEAGDDKRPQE